MKKFYSLMCAVALGAGMMSADVLDATFTTPGEMDGWNLSNNAVGVISDGHLNVEMGVQSAANGTYRADLQWMDNKNTTVSMTLTDADSFIAIKFVGTRPQGALKLVLRNNNTGLEKTFNSYNGSITTPGGNTIYYFELAKQNIELPWEINRISIVVADCKEEPFSYSVDWIKAFPTLAAVEAAATLADDGDDDADVKDVDPVTNENTGVGYTSLVDAWNAAASDDVLVLKGDATVNTRLNTDGRAITIKGNGYTVSRASGYKGMLFLTNNNSDNSLHGTITLENLTIDDDNIGIAGQTIEAGNNGKVYLTDVNIINTNTTHEMGVIAVKSGGALIANNLTISDSTVPEGYGDIFGGTSYIDLSGDCNFSLFLESAYHANDKGVSGGMVNVLFNVDKDKFNRNLTASIVDGTDSTEYFACGVSGYKLEGNDGKLFIAEDTADGIADVACEAGAVVTVYNLQGIVIRANVAAGDALADLPQGVYIVGGRKVLVK